MESPFVNPVLSRLRPDTLAPLVVQEARSRGQSSKTASILSIHNMGIALQRKPQESTCVIRQPHLVHTIDTMGPTALAHAWPTQRAPPASRMEASYGTACHLSMTMENRCATKSQGLRSVAGPHRWLQSHQVVCTTTCRHEARYDGWLHAHMQTPIS